jgi:hypothetical protein
MFLETNTRTLGAFAFAFVINANSVSSCLAGPGDIVPSVGTYALRGQVMGGGTCTRDQTLPPFKYLYFVGRTSGSTFYYLGAPGSEADAVALPPYPKPGRTWKGAMTWSVNPVTFQPPPVSTHFALDITEIDTRVVLLNGTIHVPTVLGGECSEVVGYTGVLVSGLD